MKVNQSMSILFWLYTQKKDDSGKAPIYCRITLDGNRTQFSTGKKIESTLWLSQAGKVKGDSQEARDINEDLESVKPFFIS